MPDDIIAAILREFSSDYHESELRARERRLRQQWGGASVYIKKKDPPAIRCCHLGARLAAGTGIADAFADIGVSRSTGYRLLARRWSVR